MSESDNKGKDKDYVIVVNAEQYIVSDEDVSFEQLVELAYPGQAANLDFTVTYRGAQKPKEGSLKPGGVVRVKKEGAIFNVTSTTKS